MEKSVVSIIMPTYNRAKVITEAIDSVLNQEYKNLELIIVDDGSTDNTKEIVGEYKDRRIIYHRYVENKGGNHARNIGLKLSRGEYISFLDTDNKWESEFLSRQLAIIDKYNADIVFCRINVHLDKTSGVEIYPSMNDKLFKIEGLMELDRLSKAMLRTNKIDTNTVCIKRRCILNNKFNEKLNRLQDWDFFCKLILPQSNRVAYTPDVLVHGFIQKDSIRFKHDFTMGFIHIFESWMYLYKRYGLVEDQCEFIIQISRQKTLGRVRRDTLVSLLKILPENIINKAINRSKLENIYNLKELKKMEYRAFNVCGWKSIIGGVNNRNLLLYTNSIKEAEDILKKLEKDVLDRIDYIVCEDELTGLICNGIPVVSLDFLMGCTDKLLCLIFDAYERKCYVLRKMNFIENVDFIDASEVT